jgi:hypothetical protein
MKHVLVLALCLAAANAFGAATKEVPRVGDPIALAMVPEDAVPPNATLPRPHGRKMLQQGRHAPRPCI